MDGSSSGSAAKDTESRRIEEVLYLHSLWRLGPPHDRTFNPIANPIPPKTTALTKKARKNRLNNKQNKLKKMGKRNKELEPVSGGVEWPEIPTKPPATTWEEAAAAGPPAPAPREPTADEVSVLVQRRAAVECEKLLTTKNEIDSDDDWKEEEEEVISEEEAFLFFLGFFRKENELRRHYEGNWEKGEFLCLVCLGDRAKLNRKYSGCVSLVHHAITTRKTRTRGAHRAYGKAICRALGWDFARLPSIVLDLAGPLFPPITVPDSKVVSPEDKATAEDEATDENELPQQ